MRRNFVVRKKLLSLERSKGNRRNVRLELKVERVASYTDRLVKKTVVIHMEGSVHTDEREREESSSSLVYIGLDWTSNSDRNAIKLSERVGGKNNSDEFCIDVFLIIDSCRREKF